MAMRSSTSSSERTFPRRGFPAAVVLALGLVVAVEAVFRLAPEESRLGYGGGMGAYYEVLHTLQEQGAADVAVVGSSRAREAIVVPELRESLREALHREITVGNYSCPDANPSYILLIVRKMMESRALPEVLVYFVSPPSLRVNADERPEIREVFGTFPDRFGQRSATWLASLTERPLWDLRNLLWKHYATFRYRYRIHFLVEILCRNRSSTSAMQGSYSVWQLHTPDRSLERTPPTAEQMRIFADQVLDEDGKYRVSEESLADLREAIRLAREAGVTVLLVEEPLSRPLVEALPPEVVSTFRARMAELTEGTGLGLVTMDDLHVSLELADFREQSHVNLAGARKFTAALAERMLIRLLGGAEQARR